MKRERRPNERDPDRTYKGVRNWRDVLDYLKYLWDGIRGTSDSNRMDEWL